VLLNTLLAVAWVLTTGSWHCPHLSNCPAADRVGSIRLLSSWHTGAWLLGSGLVTVMSAGCCVVQGTLCRDYCVLQQLPQSLSLHLCPPPHPPLHALTLRNWPYAWKKESASEEQYGGPNPFSEPQSRLVSTKVKLAHSTGLSPGGGAAPCGSGVLCCGAYMSWCAHPTRHVCDGGWRPACDVMCNDHTLEPISPQPKWDVLCPAGA